MDYKEKIRKLLALSESPNIHEAKAALLKARQLMAEHGLSEEQEMEQPAALLDADLTFSSRRDPWIAHLVGIIGEAYRCRGYITKGRGRTYTPHFIGLEEDVQLCGDIFMYAVECIRSGIRRIKRESISLDRDEIRQKCDSYGYGFVYGIKVAFQEQEQQWGIILAAPEKIRKIMDQIEWDNDFYAEAEEGLYKPSFAEGMEHGRKFSPDKRLGENK